MVEQVRTGILTNYNPAKGYGFIQPSDGGDDVYVHVSVLAKGSVLERGAKVSFRSTESERGERAVAVW